MLHEVLQRVPQSRELFDLLVQLDDMLVRQCFNVGARATTVLPQGEQLADLFQGKPEIAGAFDEGQGVQVVGDRQKFERGAGDA